MYLEFYGLAIKPFSKTPDPSMLFEGPQHAEALARMEQAVEDRELMVLTGDVGCGKTTLSRALIDRLPENVKPALIINPRLSPNQLLRTIARRLGAEEPKYYRSDLVEQIHELLYGYYEQSALPLIIIDEAQAIPARESFDEIRLLTNFQLDRENLMAVILMGQPELGRRLKHPAFESLRQRVGIWYNLGPLEPRLVSEYVAARLKAAGREEPLFGPKAVEALARLSRGIPRWINNLAAASLIEGFGQEAAKISEDTVLDAARDLGLLDDGEPPEDSGSQQKGDAEIATA